MGTGEGAKTEPSSTTCSLSVNSMRPRLTVLVSTPRVARRLRKHVFEHKNLKLIGVDARASIYRYDAEGWRQLFKNI